MADIKNTKDFMKAVEEVRQEYPEDAIERKIPTSFIATVAAAETGNFQFKGAPTAMKANNYFGMHATRKGSTSSSPYCPYRSRSSSAAECHRSLSREITQCSERLTAPSACTTSNFRLSHHQQPRCKWWERSSFRLRYCQERPPAAQNWSVQRCLWRQVGSLPLQRTRGP